MLETITNVSMDQNSLSQARLPDNLGGLGIPSAVDLAPPRFWPRLAAQKALRALSSVRISLLIALMCLTTLKH